MRSLDANEEGLPFRQPFFIFRRTRVYFVAGGLETAFRQTEHSGLRFN